MAAAKKHTTIVGVFEDRARANEAVAELIKSGFRQNQIGVAMRDDNSIDAMSTTDEADETHAGSGAMAGALTGLGLGALAGLGVLAGVIPVIGPAIAAGTLGVVLTNAAAGAGIAGLVGALVGAGIPEHEAEFYHSEFEAGRTLVTVTADAKAAEATAILRRFGAYDMSSRDTEIAADSSTLNMPAASARTTTPRNAARAGDTIEVKEERLRATKRPVETGSVTVRKEVHTENKTLEVPVEREEVVIERTPVRGRKSAEGISTSDIREGEEIRIPVREEQVNVTKDAVVTEEVKVGKRVIHDTEKVSGQVRKEEVKVEQTGNVNVKNGGTGRGPKRA